MNPLLPFPIQCHEHIHQEYELTFASNEQAEHNEFRFGLLIPKAFLLLSVDTKSPTIAQPVVDTVKFVSPDKRIEVLVQSSFMEMEAALDHLFEIQTIYCNETILHRRVIDEVTDRSDMLTLRKSPNGQVWVTRRVGYRMNSVDCCAVVTAYISTKLEDYGHYADLMYCVASSLKPFKEDYYPFAESLKLVSRLHPGDFATYLPESWQEQAHHVHSMHEFKAIFTKTFREQTCGVMVIAMLDFDKAPSLKEALQYFQEPYAKELAKSINVPTEPTSEITCFKSAHKGLFQYHPDKENMQMAVRVDFYIAEHKGVWYYLEMFGPTKETAFEYWAINQRALYFVKHYFKVL